MEKDKIYFAENGLTSTSANYVANMAKEMSQTAQKELDSISLINTTISLIGGTPTATNIGNENLDFVDNDLNTIIKCHSLIAWLREALKAKDNLSNEARRLELLPWCQSNGKEYPILPEQQAPITKDDVLATWSVKDRNRYLYLGAKVSAYGKVLHEGGSLSKAREELKDKLNNPSSYSLNGRDTVIVTSYPSMNENTVDTVFFKLQNEWREAQAELNGYEHKIQLAIDKDTNEKNSAYSEKCSAYEKKLSTLNAEFKAWKDITLQQIAALKVIIPNDLQGIYKTVTELSK